MSKTLYSGNNGTFRSEIQVKISIGKATGADAAQNGETSKARVPGRQAFS